MDKAKKNKKNPEKKDNAGVLLDSGTPITLGGVEYTMRRISVRDVFSFAKIMSRILSKMGQDAMNEATTDEEGAMLLMASSLDHGYAFEEFYGSLIGLTGDEFSKLSPEELTDFLDELPKQQDMKAFFKAVLRTMGTMGSLWQNA